MAPNLYISRIVISPKCKISLWVRTPNQPYSFALLEKTVYVILWLQIYDLRKQVGMCFKKKYSYNGDNIQMSFIA